MERIKVRPRQVDGEPLRVEDELGRIIPFKEKGYEVSRSTFISRLIKAGDLEWLDKPKPPPKATEKNKNENKTTGKGKAGKKEK